MKLLCAACVLVGLPACTNHPKVEPEPSLGLSTADASAHAESLKPSDAVLRDPENTVTRAVWQYGDAIGSLITTPNYRLYTTVATPTFLDALPVFYERALEQYTSALATLPQPERKLETFLFQSRRQWQSKTQEMLPDQASMFANLGRGGYTTRGTSVLYYIDQRSRAPYPRDTFAIAAHEGWHQYTQQTFKHQLPIWLEEGIATYMEGYRPDAEGLPEFNPVFNDERGQTLRDSLQQQRIIPLQDLLTNSPQTFLSESKDALLVYYAQVWALTRFLAEGENVKYREALSQILLDAAEGRLVGRMAASPYFVSGRRRGTMASPRVGLAVVQEYFNADLAEFQQQYHAFMEQLVQQSRDQWRRRR